MSSLTFPSAATATAPSIPFVPLEPFPTDAPATGGNSLVEDLNVYYTVRFSSKLPAVALSNG